MKKVEAIIQPFKLDEVREILAKSKIPRIAIFEVKGAGCQQGRLKQYWGARYIEDSVDVKIEILVDDDEAEPLAEMIVTALRTGDLCDGEVLIVPVERVFRSRVGHRVPGWEHGAAPSYVTRNTTGFRAYLKTLRRKFHEAG